MIVNNLEEMKEFARRFAKTLRIGDVINLQGQMGAGKTSLVTFIADFYKIKNATSPTFSIVNIYQSDIKIYHLDLYRFEDEDEILDIDFETYFYPQDAITFIEWSDRASSYMPDNMINLEIQKLEGDVRNITISNCNEREAQINEDFSN